MTHSANNYVDLSNLFNQKAFVTNGTSPGTPLDAAGNWLDAKSLPFGCQDGNLYPTVDGFTRFKFGPLTGPAPDDITDQPTALWPR